MRNGNPYANSEQRCRRLKAWISMTSSGAPAVASTQHIVHGSFQRGLEIGWAMIVAQRGRMESPATALLSQ